MNLKTILDAETAIDQQNAQQIEKLFSGSIKEFFISFIEDRLQESETLALPALNAAEGPLLKVLILQLAIANAEELNMRLRKNWQDRFLEIPEVLSQNYGLFWYSYSRAYQAFFDIHLGEAERIAMKSLQFAIDFQYVRGQMLSTFLLGLIYRDQDRKSEAIEMWQTAHSLAELLNLKGYQARCKRQIERINESKSSSSLSDQLEKNILLLESAVKSKSWNQARKHFIEIEATRRKKGISTSFFGHRVYFPLIAYGLGKIVSGDILQKKIKDPVERVRYFDLKESFFGLSTGEQFERIQLMDLYGLSKIKVHPNQKERPIEVCGVSVNELRSEDIKRLIELLFANQRTPIEKEKLIEELWNVDYDPVIHDPKLYRLIFQTKRVFKRSDLILNVYGSYRMNPAYLPKSSVS